MVVALLVGNGGRVVVEDHADRAALQDIEALLCATRRRTALADDDLPGVRAGRGGCRAEAVAAGNDERGRTDASGQRDAVQRQGRSAVCRHVDVVDERSVVGAGPDRGDPRTAVIRGVGGRTGVAGRGRHEDARVVSVEEGELDCVAVGVAAAADREVDDVDAIADRGLDCSGRVGAEAADLAADLEHLDVGSRGDAGDRAAADPKDRRVDTGVAGRG